MACLSSEAPRGMCCGNRETNVMAHFPAILPLSLLEPLIHFFTHLTMMYLACARCGHRASRLAGAPHALFLLALAREGSRRQQKSEGQPSEESAPKPMAELGEKLKTPSSYSNAFLHTHAAQLNHGEPPTHRTT